MSALQTKVSVYVRGELLHEQVLPPGDYVIGRGDGAHITFPMEGLVERHAMLKLDLHEWSVQDLGSGVGTFLNDEPVNRPTSVFPTQKIRIGEAHIVLGRVPGEAAAQTLTAQEAAVRRLLPREIRGERKYEIGRVIGKGGMGVIMNAHELSVRRAVAMKLMLECDKPDAIDRFFHEAQITAQLEHPNIVPVHDLGANELDQPFYTMKFVRGISLGEVLKRLELRDPVLAPGWPLSALLTVFQKLCDAIAFAHSKGVIHRDLKPDNIMLGEYGEVLVMDWGLAKVLGAPPEAPVSETTIRTSRMPAVGSGDETTIGPTISGTVMGTPQFMAPEQAQGEIEMMDVTTDIYALGSILYYMIALKAPLGGKGAAEALEKARLGAVVPFSEACAGRRLPHLPGGRVPDSLAAVVAKAMAFEKAQRYPTVKALQTEIEAYQTGFATSAEHASAWRLMGLFLRRHRTVSSAAALLLLSGVIFTIYLVRERNRAERASAQAQAARVVADEQRDAAENHLYLSHMLQAGRHLIDGRPESARELLLQHRSETSGRDLRNWEWFYLLGQLNQDRLRVHAHTGGVYALAASADGTRIATGGGDGEVAVWQARGLVPQFRLPAHAGAVLTVAWHDAGKLLASGGAGGTVRIWDFETRRSVAEIQVAKGKAVRSIAWRPHDNGGPTLAIGSQEKEIQLWRPLATGDAAKPETLATTSHGVASLHWSADGTRLAAGELDTNTTLEVFDVATKAKVLSTRASTGTDLFVTAFDPTGKYVAAGTKHLIVTVLEVNSKKKVFAEPLHRGFVSSLAWSPDGRQLASASHDGTIRLSTPLDETNSPKVLCGHTGEINAVTWINLPALAGGADTAVLFSGGADGTLRAWIPAPSSHRALLMKPGNWVSAAQWSPAGDRLAIANFKDLLYLADPASGLSLPLHSTHGNLFDAVWSPAGDRLATASRGSHRVEVLDAATGRSLGIFPLPEVDRLAWSASGRYLAGASTTGTRIWDTKTGTQVAVISRPTGSLAWHPDEKRIAVGGVDGAIQLWDALSGKMVAEWRSAPPPMTGSVASDKEPPRQVFDLRWSADARFLAFGTQDSIAGLLDGKDGRLVRTFPGHVSGVWRLGWSRDGQRLATAGQDGVLRVYDVRAGGQVAQLNHGLGNAELHAIDWSSSGRQLLTGGYDRMVRIWDAERGYQLDAVEKLAREAKAQPNDVATLRPLANTYAQLGWVGDARRTVNLAQALVPNDETLRSAGAEFETAFAAALDATAIGIDRGQTTPARNPRILQHLNAIHDAWEGGKGEAALRAFQELVRLPGATERLPLATTYFSRARWTASWFPSKADPVQDVEGWRALAGGPDSVTIGARILCFPYQMRGPKGLSLAPGLTERGPGGDHFGMIARTRLNLPAGKWRFLAIGEGGVRILVNSQPVLENWAANAPVEKTAIYEQASTADVALSVEHFVNDATPGFQFLIEPVVN